MRLFQRDTVIDPTKNVLDLVRAETKRQDDLREFTADALRRESALRDDFYTQLRMAEAARIDAIRAVDVGAVQRAAEVQLAQATALATQQATIAETLRGQVAAAAGAQATALGAALVPLQEAIADLRRAQYEQAGSKAQTVEGRLNYGAILGGLSVVMVLVFSLVNLLSK